MTFKFTTPAEARAKSNQRVQATAGQIQLLIEQSEGRTFSMSAYAARKEDIEALESSLKESGWHWRRVSGRGFYDDQWLFQPM
jgi:hypothetical protein